MALSDVVNVNVSISSSSVSLPGFGVPMVLSVHSNFAERLRYYTAAADMLTDGFLTTDQAYVDALAMFSQNPRPRRVAIGRRATAVAQVSRVTVVGNGDGNYTVSIDDNGLLGSVDYTFAASSNTVEQIRDGIKALIDAGSQDVSTASVSTDAIDITADTAGIPMIIAVASPASDMTLAVQTANVGIPEDLQAITDEEPDWYMLDIVERDPQHILTAAKEIEAQRRMFGAQSNDAAILSAAYDVGTPEADIASKLKSLNYARTHLWYHPTDTEALVASVMGRCLPETPASITWKFKELAGISSTVLTDTQLSNLRGDPQSSGQGKCANAYTPLAGRDFTQEGTVSSGEFIDVIRGIDKLVSRIQALQLGAFLSSPKVPYDNTGIPQIEASVRSAIVESQREGLLAIDPVPVITSPDALDIDSGTKATRALSGSNAITFTATLQGAVHAVEVTGTVSA